jgi:hypothetical protein
MIKALPVHRHRYPSAPLKGERSTQSQTPEKKKIEQRILKKSFNDDSFNSSATVDSSD